MSILSYNNVSQPNLANWCRGEGLDQAHAILVIGVPEEEDISTVEDTLEQVKTLGKVRVRGKMFDANNQTLTMLCECRQESQRASAGDHSSSAHV
uniref:Paraneoplastic antigen Ma-like N-terminal domain-containing protein n=1 Tax=Oreochromis niloticus TaxID=8128 RepID=A0A669DNF0_ORENI